MLTYYIRHTWKLDIDHATRKKLWDARQIALHFPHDKFGPPDGPDSSSIKPGEYQDSAKKAMTILVEIATSGGYVCAEYAHFPHTLVGVVDPKTEITLVEGKWGDVHKLAGRTAVLKTLQLQRVQELEPSRSAALLVGRPRQGTIIRWPNVGEAVKNLVENVATTGQFSDLLPAQQEIICAEFLRTPAADEFGLPRLAHQLLPAGRTMRDVDIYGMAVDGKRLIAQVTYLARGEAGDKLERLRKFHDASSPHLILFCRTDAVVQDGSVTIAPIEAIVTRFRDSQFGNQWFAFANHAPGV